MAEGHVPEELLRRFLRVEVSPEEARRVVRHLVAGCPRCAELAHQLSQQPAPSSRPWDDRYEEVFARSLTFASSEEERVGLEKLRGREQWAHLEPMNPGERRALVEADPSYHTFGFYDRLLEACRRVTRTEPAEAVELLRLAVTVADRLDPKRTGQMRVADLRATARGELGNAKRLASDFPGARRAFDEAWRIFEEEGSNDPLERARLLSLEASYLNDQGELEAAEATLEKALELYRQVGDIHLQRRTLHELCLLSTDLAEVLVKKGELGRAAELVEEIYPILEAWGLHRYALRSLRRILLELSLRPQGDASQR